MPSLRKTKRSAKPNHRAEYQQLEYQRKNPHLFTTLNQSVGAYGEIVTFGQVTREIQKTLTKLEENHTSIFKGKHPEYCMRPIIGQSENPVCQAIEYLNDQLDTVRMGFVRNYKHMQDSLASRHSNIN